jgi:DNA polymerase bacteriophage-type
MKPFWIDIETRSRCDLVKHGVYRYAADPSTEILIICYALADGPIKTWHKGQPLPPTLQGALAKPNGQVQLTAHNAAFERHVLGVRFPTALDPRRWYCTATQARAVALAGSLEAASHMLGTQLRKERRGSELIRLLSMPQPDGSFLEDRGLLEEFARYCAQDVAVMRQMSNGMPPLTAEAQALYVASETSNDRGLPIDTELCCAALEYAEQAATEATARIQAVTGGAINSARSIKLTQWIYERIAEPHRHLMEVTRVDVAGMIKGGPGAAGGIRDVIRGDALEGRRARAPGATQRQGLALDVGTRASLLEAIDLYPDDFSDEVIAAIEAAEDAAMASVAKFGTMLNRVSADGRLRGAFVMNGAAQTGRFSSTGAQLHNFPRLVAADPPALRQLILRRGDLGGSVLTALKSMLRPAIRSHKGLIVRADWNAVEARGLPWLAGPRAARYLDTWRDASRDPYIEQARAAGLGEHRQAGKVVVLSLGYGGGPNALGRMSANNNVTIGDKQQVVWNWRNANTWAPSWWSELEAAAYIALRKRDGEWVKAQRISFAADHFGLVMRLPSGRQLRYPFAQFEWQGEQSKITYLKAAWKPKAGAKQWPRATMWHGTLAENATQATCGDLLRLALVACVGDGLPLIGHVHDELIAEAPNGKAATARDLARALQQRMLDLPAWAKGLPLAVETDSAPYYRK